MKRFESMAEQRKDLVKKLEELTGQKARYTFVPRCAYEVGVFTVEKNGTLLAGDDADVETIRALQEAGLIGAGIEEAAETEPEPVEAQAEAEPEAVQAEPGAAEPEPEPDEEQPAVETDVEPQPAETDGAFPLDADITLPLTRHTGNSLRNLVNLIYSRGQLISRATGGCFSISRELAEAMQDVGGAYSVNDFLVMQADCQVEHGGGMDGIRFESDGIYFDGFTDVEDEAHLRAYTTLAAKMNQMALTQKRIQLKEVDMTNEKFAMRTWLVRMGMGGAEYKEARRILLEKLTGHSAFRTPAAEERAKAKAIQKRDELRVAKQEAEEEARLNAELSGLNTEQAAEAVEDAGYIAEFNAYMES